MAMRNIVLTGLLVIGLSMIAQMPAAYAYCDNGDNIAPDGNCLRNGVPTGKTVGPDARQSACLQAKGADCDGQFGQCMSFGAPPDEDDKMIRCATMHRECKARGFRECVQ